MVLKIDVYGELVKRVNAIDTSEIAKKADYHTNISAIKIKIPSISDLATTDALNDINDKIPDASNLVKKQIMMIQYQILTKSISSHLIMTNL